MEWSATYRIRSTPEMTCLIQGVVGLPLRKKIGKGSNGVSGGGGGNMCGGNVCVCLCVCVCMCMCVYVYVCVPWHGTPARLCSD